MRSGVVRYQVIFLDSDLEFRCNYGVSANLKRTGFPRPLTDLEMTAIVEYNVGRSEVPPSAGQYGQRFEFR